MTTDPKAPRRHLAAGGCLCGAVRYAVASEPEWIVNCGCRFCQRATGGAYLVETLFPLDDLDVLSGTPKTHDRRSEGSGKTIRIHFCGTCGTKLFMTFERFDDIYGVFSGTFDDPNWFPRPPEKTNYFFLGEMPDGVVLPPGSDVFYGHALKPDGSENTPQRFEVPTVVTGAVRTAALEFARRNGEV